MPYLNFKFNCIFYGNFATSDRVIDYEAIILGKDPSPSRSAISLTRFYFLLLFGPSIRSKRKRAAHKPFNEDR
jgi:hypothetical protein